MHWAGGDTFAGHLAGRCSGWPNFTRAAAAVAGDVIGLLVDLEAGSLAVYRNGDFIGLPVRGSAQGRRQPPGGAHACGGGEAMRVLGAVPLCWAVDLQGRDCIRVRGSSLLAAPAAASEAISRAEEEWHLWNQEHGHDTHSSTDTSSESDG